MEKNTAWAIGLSTVVLVGFFFVQSYLMPKPENVQTNQTTAVTQETSATDKETEEVQKSLIESEVSTVQEEQFVLETEKVKVIFTNRGGDIVSYELKNHSDSETKQFIQMAENISDKNRAFSVSLGNSNAQIVDDIFNSKRIDDNTIGFYKKFFVNNEDGTKGEFTLVKTYYFKDSDDVFKLEINVDPGENFKGLNIDNVGYSIRTSPQIGPAFDPKIDRYENRQFISFNGKKKKKVILGNNQTKSFDKEWNWVAMAGKYFEILTLPENKENMENKVVYSSKSDLEGKNNGQIIMSRKSIGSNGTKDSYYIYVGPRNEKDLRVYNVPENNNWKLDGVRFDNSTQSSGILSWLEVVLKFLMEMINKVVKNWGVSIIILTVLLKLAMFPITAKTAKSTAKMQEMQPKMQALQEKYKDNPAKLNEQTAKLYKEIGYNPLSGCLPMLFQFVILFAMYNLFNNYFEFRGACFIPGWISDLSKGDSVKTLGFDIPFLGNQIRLLPVIYVLSQIFFSKITQNGGTATGQNNGQMKFMMYGLPIIFFFMFYNAPSGLLLYWTISNLIQLVQQLVINSSMAKAKQTSAKVKLIKK